MIYGALNDLPGLEIKRHKYAMVLGELIMKNKKIVYIDETKFNTWLRKSHSWYFAGDK